MIFNEHIDDDLFEDKKLLTLIQTYKTKYEAGDKPQIKDFAYLSDNNLAQAAIAVTNFPYELSKRWVEDEMAAKVNSRIWELNYEDFMKEVVHNEDYNKVVYIHQIDEDYKYEVDTVLVYLKIRKVNRLILMNQIDLQKPESHEKLIEYQQTHIHLKGIQMQLGSVIGNVIFPFG